MSFQGGVLPGASTLEEAFTRYQGNVDQLHSERFGPYSGTFAAKKLGLIRIDGEWESRTAMEHCIEYNRESEPVYIYELEVGWWIGGWCAE